MRVKCGTWSASHVTPSLEQGFCFSDDGPPTYKLLGLQRPIRGQLITLRHSVMRPHKAALCVGYEDEDRVLIKE